MKKAYLILVALIAILSISAVSAGLFDFGSDDSNQKEFYKVSGKILDSSFKYKITGKADTRNSPAVSVTEDDFQYYMSSSGVVKINISNATEDQLNNISKTIEDYDFDNDNEFDISLVTDLNESRSITAGHVKSASLNGTVMTVKFSDSMEIPKKMQSGSGEICSGELTYLNGKNGFSINFYCD